jgi:bacterioferritin (cytochrome b1)
MTGKEEYFDWIDSPVDLIKKTGIQNYNQPQMS